MTIKEKIQKSIQKQGKAKNKNEFVYNMKNLRALEPAIAQELMKNKRKEDYSREIRNISNSDIDTLFDDDDEYLFLLKEVVRFINENQKFPTNKDMNVKFGYPNSAKYYEYFNMPYYYKSNKGVSAAVDTLASICNSRNLKLPFVQTTEKVSAIQKYHFFETIEGSLLHVLNCKTDGRKYHKYHNIISENYGKIVLKFSSLNNNIWIFNLRTKIKDNQDIDNFICVGIDSDLTQIKYIWCIPNSKFDNIKNLTVYDTKGSLERLKQKDITDLFNTKRLIM